MVAWWVAREEDQLSLSLRDACGEWMICLMNDIEPRCSVIQSVYHLESAKVDLFVADSRGMCVREKKDYNCK